MKKGLLIVLGIGLLSLLFEPGSVLGAGKPQYGGVLKGIYTSGPVVLGYIPQMGPSDNAATFPGAERLVNTTTERQTGSGIEPVLCERYAEDKDNLTITWYIRKGVKFHDGSDLTADVVRWNFQMIIDAKALPYITYYKSMEVVDKYTLVMHLTKYSNQLIPSWGWWPLILSKKAFEKASGGDLKKGIEWARDHLVGTGPFMLKEFKRDVHIKWVKNPNYWRKGRPYLDGITYYYIPDSVTASAMLQAGEVDIWINPPAKDEVDLMSQGFYRQSAWPALGYSIYINTANPESKWQDKRLREAVEYAINKEAMTKALGFGLYRPLPSLPPKGEWGYDPNYYPRPFNPEKARQLLAEAGYKNGLKIKMLVPVFYTGAQDSAMAIKQFLDDVGFNVTLDMADPGRYFSAMQGKMPDKDADLAWWITGRDTNYLMTYMRWFSTEPFTDWVYLGHTPEQKRMDQYAQSLTNIKDQEAITKKLMRHITDNALIIPLYDPPMSTMQQPYVHSTQYTQGFVRWQTEEIWMEKH